MNKVFDKFRQIENSLNRKTGGTGLGLPIAKQLVNAHNGFIWVESKVKRIY
ncbi:MAG: ATP-binding protein [Candidatus Melainabacteria bacterium]|nr:MAG: ATP-binding protein [Candidatus Melainabacteria bacterium]